jgi:DNA-binding transcriptional MerR regulator
VPVKTIRYYSDAGLLAPAARSAARYRLYGPGDRMRLEQIRILRELGFGLDAVERLLGRGADPRAIVDTQLRAVELHLRHLARAATVLRTALGGGDPADATLRVGAILRLAAWERDRALRETLAAPLRKTAVDPAWLERLLDGAFAGLPEELADDQWGAFVELVEIVTDPSFGAGLAAQADPWWRKARAFDGDTWQRDWNALLGRGMAALAAAESPLDRPCRCRCAGDLAFTRWRLALHRRLSTSSSVQCSRRRLHRDGHRPTSSPPRPMTKHTILFLAANPTGTDRLALDREARAIQVELERAGSRDRFELVTRWAVEPLDLLRELRKLKPTVVHFSGHGGRGVVGASSWSPPPSASAPRRDVDDGSASLGAPGPIGAPAAGTVHGGLYFQGLDGSPRLVSAAALEDTFGAAGASVRLVVLSACYSDAQAQVLLAHVDCVVGMSGAIDDDAARSFAIGFYGGLGERESIAAAFRQGRAAIGLEGLRDADRPQLLVRAGVDPSRLVLAADPR